MQASVGRWSESVGGGIRYAPAGPPGASAALGATIFGAMALFGGVFFVGAFLAFARTPVDLLSACFLPSGAAAAILSRANGPATPIPAATMSPLIWSCRMAAAPPPAAMRKMVAISQMAMSFDRRQNPSFWPAVSGSNHGHRRVARIVATLSYSSMTAPPRAPHQPQCNACTSQS